MIPGDSVRVEVYVQDQRLDDGDNNALTSEFGIYAAYTDLQYDQKAFKVLATPQNNQTGKPVLPFAASFQDPRKYAFIPGLSETFYYDYPNGPKGDITSAAGVINDVGSFSGATSATGKGEMFQLDVRLQARAVWAENDTGTVNEGAAVSINVLNNDELITGQKFFTPASPVTAAGAASGSDFLVFGNTGFGTGSTGKGSIVPWYLLNPTRNLVQSLQDDVVINNTGTKTLIDVGTDAAPGKGTVAIVSGQARYTANNGVVTGAGPVTRFSYRIANGVNNALYEVGTVTVTINAVNDPPVNTVPASPQVIDEDNPLDFVGAKTISVADPDAGTGTLQVQLVATNGTLTLGDPSQVSYTFNDADGTGAGDGTADATLRFRGTLTQLNTALANSFYRPSTNYNGSATVTMTTNDLRNTGSAAQIDTDVVTVTVLALERCSGKHGARWADRYDRQPAAGLLAGERQPDSG